LGEPIIIEFQVTNRWLPSSTLDLGVNREEAFAFDISAPDGTRSRVRAPQHEREGTFRIGQVALKKGESYTQRIRISEWYLFSKAGTYTITGELAPSGTSDS